LTGFVLTILREKAFYCSISRARAGIGFCFHMALHLQFFKRILMSKSIYVGNLPWSATEEQVQDLFAEYGNVISINLVSDRETGRARGFGFVEMDGTDASKAIEALNNYSLDGRALRVNEAQPKSDAPRRPSRPRHY